MTSDIRRYIAGYNVANSRRFPIRRRVIFASALELGDNCIPNIHLGRYVVGYMVGNFVLRRRVSGAVKRFFRPYNRWYTYPNENFEYGYPHSNALFNIYSTKHSFLHQTEAPSATQNNYVNQSQATSLMTSVLRRYIAEYTDANSSRYPIRRRVYIRKCIRIENIRRMICIV